jgi:hypothetical protein
MESWYHVDIYNFMKEFNARETVHPTNYAAPEENFEQAPTFNQQQEQPKQKMCSPKGTELKDSLSAALFAIFHNPQVKKWWVCKITKTLGVKATIRLLTDSLALAYSEQCPLIDDQSRKRDWGGLAIQLLHSSKYVTADQHQIIFGSLKKFK